MCDCEVVLTALHHHQVLLGLVLLVLSVLFVCWKQNAHCATVFVL